jgi:type VI secretion system secreted protein VgrG
MGEVTQSGRHIGIETPLGEDALLLRGFTARAQISGVTAFELDLVSEDDAIAFADIVGKNVTIRMNVKDGGKRYWNGFITQFAQVSTLEVQFAEYTATMVTWPWFLKRTSDCRIFQKKTVPDIINEIFEDLGFTDIEDRLSGGYRTWDYCVQYNETDFDFVSRLMEQEGIYYYFSHEQGSHKLVLCDSSSKHDSVEGYDEILFRPSVTSSEVQERIDRWKVETRVQSGKYAFTDYNFSKPKTSLMVTQDDVKGHDKADFEIYEYPGQFGEGGDGNRYSRIRMEELAQPHELCNGEGFARGIHPGCLFTLVDHPRSDQNREYLVLEASYDVKAEGYETADGPTEDQFRCVFTAMPSVVQYRPPRVTPKPRVYGTIPAIVVGPAGDEIYTDENGRVKVQFYWDREGADDENSSCWLRVSQPWAGQNWGAVFLPRIGHEVLVSFMAGDPDQPVVTGRVYNADNMPPYELPANKTQSGIKSRSSLGGSPDNFNEFRFEDKKGSELVYMHAERNLATIVEVNEARSVGNDRATKIGRDDTTEIDRDEKRIVHKNRTTLVEVDDTIEIKNNESRTIHVDRTTKIGSNDSLTIGGNRSTQIGGKETLSVSGGRETSIGESDSHSIGADGTQNVGGNYTQNVGSNHSVSVGADQTLTVSGAAALSASTREVQTAGNYSVMASGKIAISSASKIELSCGGSKIVLSPGSIDIQSATINVTGAGTVTVMGGLVKLNC